MTHTKTLACARWMLIALMTGAGGLAHADTTGERDRTSRAERGNERRESATETRRESRRDAAQDTRETRQDRRSDARDTRSTVRQDTRDVRRDTVQQQRETRQDHRNDARDIRSSARQDFREDRRDDRRAAHVERRHYPSRGAVIQALPPAHRVVTHRGGRYMFSGGVWYRPSGSRFVVVAPPLGIVVPVLPLGYLTLRIGPSRYYYMNDVYYAPNPRGYVVVERPAGATDDIDYEEDDAADTEPPQFIYPRHGQSDAQQAEDRYECHRWAREQTGFDPTRAMAEWSDTQLELVRSDYYRAMGACLDGRGYTVR